MKKIFSIFTLLFSICICMRAYAYEPPQAPSNGNYVVDQSGKMSSSQIANLNLQIQKVSAATKNEFGILLLQDMGGDNIEDVAYTTFNAWGIGKHGLDNGCLIVVSITERKSRIETGKGVEGEVTDLQAAGILKNNLNPHLKSGDFAGGFADAISALSSLMENRTTVTKVNNPAPSNDGDVLASFALLALVFGFILFIAKVLRIRSEANLKLKRFNSSLDEFRYINPVIRTNVNTSYSAQQPSPPYKSKVNQVILPPSFKKRDTAKVTKSTTVTYKNIPTNAVDITDRRDDHANHKRDEDLRRKREEEDRRKREEEDRRKRDDDDRRKREESYYNDSSSYTSSSTSSFDGGSSFGGGSSGGGGSSSDW